RRAVVPPLEALAQVETARAQQRRRLRVHQQQLDVHLLALDDAEDAAVVPARRVARGILEALGRQLDRPDALHGQVDDLVVPLAAPDQVEAPAVDGEGIRLE